MPARHPTWALLAWAWVVLVCALSAHQVGFWRAPQLESDVMALLPEETHDPQLQRASAQMLDAATREVVVLVGGGQWSQALAASRAFSSSLRTDDLLRQVTEQDFSESALRFYAPFRQGLLTPEQRERLQHQPVDVLAGDALAMLYGPGTGNPGAWADDPMGLAAEWWQARLGRGLSLRDGVLAASDGTAHWAVLRFALPTSAFRLDGKARLLDALDAAAKAAQSAAPGVTVLRAGVPLHAEAAAVRANWEINTIGLGSLLAVVGLLWLAFGSLRPILLVSLSLLIGCAAGVAATVLVFGDIHLLTLVFGASLVGVAEDYSIHYFACRHGREELSTHQLMRYLMPSLLLALLTSVLAYLALGAAPFPGLRQMALFSATGLVAAFVTVGLWFPWLDHGTRPPSRFGRVIAASLPAWPRLQARRAGSWLAAAAIVLFCITGLQRLETRDDLRNLQSSPPALLAQQVQVGRLLGMPSPSQFYMVSGDSEQALLQREEMLTSRLAALESRKAITGYGAISDWVPSKSRQLADARLAAGVEAGVMLRVSESLGEQLHPGRPLSMPLAVSDWLAQPISLTSRWQWLGSSDGRWASVVTLRGLDANTDLALLARQVDGVPGVRWVDRTGDISRLLGHYRAMMSQLLLAGFLVVAGVLWWRYRRLAWRAWVPTAIASVLSLAALGWLGEPFQLFNVLALLLLLGVGIDYGIFLVEHNGDGASWLAVCLGAASTLLAFGLLALSATPALHGFGLTMLFGVGSVWLLSPCFRPPVPASISSPPFQSRHATPNPASETAQPQEEDDLAH